MHISRKSGREQVFKVGSKEEKTFFFSWDKWPRKKKRKGKEILELKEKTVYENKATESVQNL